jgi:hypothetical protein
MWSLVKSSLEWIFYNKWKLYLPELEMHLVKLFELMIADWCKRSNHQCHERRKNIKKKRKRRRKKKRKKRKRSQRNIIVEAIARAVMSVTQEETEEMKQETWTDTEIEEGLLEMQEIWREVAREEMIEVKEGTIVMMIALESDLEVVLGIDEKGEKIDLVPGIE